MYQDREPTQCIKIGGNVLRYGAESRNPTQRIKRGDNVLRYGAESRKPSQCIKIGNACIKIGRRLKIGTESRVKVLRYVMHVLGYGIGCFRHIFRHCEGKNFKNFWLGPPARIIIRSADNLFACG